MIHNPGERSGGLNIDIKAIEPYINPIISSIESDIRFAGLAAREALTPLAVLVGFAVQKIGDRAWSEGNKSKQRAISTIAELSLLLTACMAGMPTKEKPNFDPTAISTLVVEKETPVPTPTLNVEQFRGEDVELELVTDPKELTQKAKEFENGSLIFQTLTSTVEGVKFTESKLENPGEGAKYKLLSAFEVKDSDGKVKDEFQVVRGMDGEQFLTIKLKNIETGQDEYVQLQVGREVTIPGEGGGVYLPFLYFDYKEDGSLEYFYPISLETSKNGFTGNAIYGEDQDTYSRMILGNSFSVKNAMITQQLEATLLDIEKELKAQGINEYNLGIDPGGMGLAVYDAEGNILVKEGNRWVEDAAAAGVEMISPGSDAAELMKQLDANPVTVEALKQAEEGFDTRIPSAAQFNKWALENSPDLPDGTAVVVDFEAAKQDKNPTFHLLKMIYDEEMNLPTDLPLQYYVKKIVASEGNRLYPDVLPEGYDSVLVITTVVKTKYGKVAMSMFTNGDLTPEQFEKLMNYIGDNRLKMILPVFNTGTYTSDSFEEDMAVLAADQVVETKWTDPKSKKERNKYVGDVWVEMEETTLAWSETNLDVTAENIEEIQEVYDRTILPAAAWSSAVAFNAKPK